MFNAFFAKRLFTVFALIALSAIPFQVYGESTTAFGKQGPYGVAMSEVSGEGLLLVPQVADGSQAKKQWPGIGVRSRSLWPGAELFGLTAATLFPGVL